MIQLTEPSHLGLCCLQTPIIITCGSERVKLSYIRNCFMKRLQCSTLLFLFQLPRLLESHVAADINFRAATVSDYTDAINLLACHQGLPHPVKHGRSRSYPIVALLIIYSKHSTQQQQLKSVVIPLNIWTL